MKTHISVPLLAVLLASLATANQGFWQDDGKARQRLANSEAIKLELLHRALEAGESPEVLNKPYRKKDRFQFRLRITNTSTIPVDVLITDPYFQNRPELFRDGQLVEYRKGLADLLESKENEPSARHNGYARLEPSEFKVLGYVKLGDWYAPLEPGHYQLCVKRRFEYGQQWIESNAVTFDVVNK